MSRLLTNTALALTIFFLWTGCESKPVQEKISDTVQLLNEGELRQASEQSARLLEKTDLSSRERRLLDSVNQIAHRINIDFCLSESEVIERLNIYHSGINSIGLRHLENEHKLDFRYVDGEKKYFKNCVGNLFLLDSSYNRLKRMKDGPLKDSLPGFRLRHSSEVVKISKAPGETVHPVRFRLSYKITVDINAVPVVKLKSHLPVILDPSHGTGRSALVGSIAKAGIAAGADGLIIEVHDNPEEAWSDGEQSLCPERFQQLMRELGRIAQAVDREI